MRHQNLRWLPFGTFSILDLTNNAFKMLLLWAPTRFWNRTKSAKLNSQFPTLAFRHHSFALSHSICAHKVVFPILKWNVKLSNFTTIYFSSSASKALGCFPLTDKGKHEGASLSLSWHMCWITGTPPVSAGWHSTSALGELRAYHVSYLSSL